MMQNGLASDRLYLKREEKKPRHCFWMLLTREVPSKCAMITLAHERRTHLQAQSKPWETIL